MMRYGFKFKTGVPPSLIDCSWQHLPRTKAMKMTLLYLACPNPSKRVGVATVNLSCHG